MADFRFMAESRYRSFAAVLTVFLRADPRFIDFFFLDFGSLDLECGGMTPLLGPRHVAARESAVVPAHSKTAKFTEQTRFDSIRSMKRGCAHPVSGFASGFHLF